MRHVVLATTRTDEALNHVQAYGPFDSERDAKHFAMDELWANRGLLWSVCVLHETLPATDREAQSK